MVGLVIELYSIQFSDLQVRRVWKLRPYLFCGTEETLELQAPNWTGKEIHVALVVFHQEASFVTCPSRGPSKAVGS